MTHKITYRRARFDDLLPAFKMVMFTFNHLRRIHSLKPAPVMPRDLPPIPLHLYKSDAKTAWCAWDGDKIVGYGHALNRGKQWYLAYLFVHPRVQDKGVGRQLLERVWRDEPGVTHSLCTFSYNPQAVGIYSQFGMSPIVNIPIMTTTVGRLRKPRRPGLLVSEQPTTADVSWINRLETDVRGYRRPEEWRLWTTHPDFKSYVFRYKGERVGYAAVYKNGMIGPVGAVSSQYLLRAVAELLHLMPADKDQVIRIQPISTNIPLYRMLIECGFRCEELSVFMTDKPYADFDRYIPTHLAIF